MFTSTSEISSFPPLSSLQIAKSRPLQRAPPRAAPAPARPPPWRPVCSSVFLSLCFSVCIRLFCFFVSHCFLSAAGEVTAPTASATSSSSSPSSTTAVETGLFFCLSLFFFLCLHPPPKSPLFPHSPLFRSRSLGPYSERHLEQLQLQLDHRRGDRSVLLSFCLSVSLFAFAFSVSSFLTVSCLQLAK